MAGASVPNSGRLNTHPFLAGDGPILMAHRGGAAEVHENTWGSLRHIVDLGVSYVETDVHGTRDGVVVLQHDDALDRTTDTTGLLTARTWAELGGVRNLDGEPLVRLEDALEQFPSLRFNVDAKSDSVVGSLAEMAARHPDRVLVASFSTPRLLQVRRLAPSVATSLGQGEVVRLCALSRLPLASALRLAGCTKGFRHAVAVQVPPRYRGFRVITPRLVRLAHALGLAVHAWDSDAAASWEAVLEAGADGIITDFPTTARDWLAGRGPWH
ncbi:MAG TPA: glycerophosphodiester phosphodiesterase family protein [Actinomycetaceae bacterium]|nr:glycerophosphodiester phosphodiesterase family protein [Actinomycetaceae bacterium]